MGNSESHHRYTIKMAGGLHSLGRTGQTVPCGKGKSVDVYMAMGLSRAVLVWSQLVV
jgi:hypothetical protein